MVQKKVTIIVPAYNEEGNIKPLIERLIELQQMDTLRDYETIIVDDGSMDKTYDIAHSFEKKYKWLKVVRHRANLGKTEGIISGLKNSEGEILVILDADLQYDPLEIPSLIEKIGEGYDIVSGWKQGKYEKKFVSRLYNLLSRILFRIPVHDQNAVKAMRREVLEEIPLRKDWHRYIISLAVDKGFKATEVKVTLHPRKAGTSKYSGKGRIVVGVLDLLAVKFQVSFMKKPLLLFGTTGGISILLGFLIGIYVMVMRFGFHKGWRPLLYLIMLLVIAGLLLFAIGFLAEVIASVFERLERIERDIGEKKK
ncbi:glycosyltransferase family 2 protein [candidate division WOR-3 bacterium]|nr:glycosyltransferase family 2 protein [candidate division WOR-3 bacterium]